MAQRFDTREKKTEEKRWPRAAFALGLTATSEVAAIASLLTTSQNVVLGPEDYIMACLRGLVVASPGFALMFIQAFVIKAMAVSRRAHLSPLALWLPGLAYAAAPIWLLLAGDGSIDNVLFVVALGGPMALLTFPLVSVPFGALFVATPLLAIGTGTLPLLRNKRSTPARRAASTAGRR